MICPWCQAGGLGLPPEACPDCGRIRLCFEPNSEVLGRYLVKDLIGSGGQGQVIRAFDQRYEVEIALKYITSRAAVDFQRLRREAGRMRLVSHQNLCAVYECHLPPETEFPLLAMQFLQGVTLLQTGEVSFTQVFTIGSQAAEGLAALHRAQLLHRDIKPENIHIGADQTVRLIDFSLVKPVVGGDITTPGMVPGTPRYMAKEIFEGDLSPKGDVFALALVIAERLTKHLAPTGQIVEIWKSRVDLPDEFSPHLSGQSVDVRSTLLAALDPRPDKRPDATTLSAVLSAAAVAASAATPTQPVQSAKHSKRRSRTHQATDFPFGEPDGLNQSEESLSGDQFLVFEDLRIYGGLATRPDDPNVRIFVGRKGSGKTAYLRRHYFHAKRTKGHVALGYSHALPSFEAAQLVGRLFDGPQLVDEWREAWSAAVLACVADRMVTVRDLQEHVPGQAAEEIKSLLQRLRCPPGSAPTIESTLNHIASRAGGSRESWSELVHSGDWAALAVCLQGVVANGPVISTYIDAADEKTDMAPRELLACQAGLYRAVRDFFVANWHGRLRVCAAIRESVLLAEQMREDFRKSFDTPQIRRLVWDREAVGALLSDKLSKLDAEYFLSGSAGARTVRDWLGVDRVTNGSRGIEERVEDYCLSHTRFLPRDLLEVGNSICRAMVVARSRRQLGAILDQVKMCVSVRASAIGLELLETCAIEVTARLKHAVDPREPLRHIDANNDQRYLWCLQELQAAIRETKTEAFDQAAMQRFRHRLDTTFVDTVNGGQQLVSAHEVVDVLWWNGLLGYFVDAGARRRYYSETRPDDRLPRDAEKYVWHRTLIDAVGVRANGPVV